MKSWLLKFRISNALNDGRALPPEVEQAVSRCEEAGRFAENCKVLDRTLENELPVCESPVALHAGIMRSIRNAARPPAAKNQPAWPQWIAVSSLSLLVAFGVFVAVQFSTKPLGIVKPGESDSFAAAGSALELGNTLILRDAPAAAVAPLSEEMARLDLDLARTREFLMASLP